MRIKVSFLDKKYEINKEIRNIEDILSIFRLNKNEVLVLRNGEILDDNSTISDGDSLEIIPVTSKG